MQIYNYIYNHYRKGNIKSYYLELIYSSFESLLNSIAYALFSNFNV